jgi:hypothetical protein
MRPRALIAFVVVSAALGSCSVGGQGHAKVADDDAVPFGLLDENAPSLVPSPTAAVTQPVAACFVTDNRLEVVSIALDPPVQLKDIIAALTRPPANAPGSPRTAIGDPPIVRTVRLEAGTAHVDLQPSVADLGGQEQLLAVAQLVCTLTGRPGVGQVSFTLDGAPVDVPRGDGSLTNEPVSRDDYAALLA